MTVKFTNNASSTLSSGINSSVTSLTVASASAFPQLAGADDYCYLTIQQATGTVREVVKATALSSNTFTIIRAQDNTTAQSFSAGDTVELRMTAALLTDVIDAATVEGVKTNFQYTPTAGQTVFSGADNSSNTMIINQSGLVNVYMNGVRLVQGTDYTVSAANNTITLTTGATTADIIDIEVYGNFTGQSGAAVAITGGSITGTAITATTLGASGTATLNTFVSSNATISGGTINNVAIGGTTQAAGNFTDITGSTATLTTSGNNTQLTLKSTDPDAGGGPRLDLTRDSASPADGDVVGQIRFMADNDAGTETSFGLIRMFLSDVSDGAEAGRLEIDTKVNGTNQTRLKMSSSETVVNEDGQDLDFRVESNNKVNMLLVDAGDDVIKVGGITGGASGTLKVKSNSSHHAIALEEHSGSENYSLGVVDDGSLIFANSGTEVVRFSDSGTVGIGRTPASTVMLDITEDDSATDLIIGLTAGTGGRAQIRSVAQSDGTSSALSFHTMTGSNTSEALRITPSGDVGIGTNSPHSSGTSFTVLNLNGTKGGSLAFSRGTNSATKQWAIRTSDDEDLRFEYGSTLASEAMRIDSSGKLGIGNSSPSYLIHADAATATDPSYVAASSGSDFIVAIGSQNSPGVAQEAFVGTLSNDALKIKTNNTERLRITNGGRLGINRTSPNGLLHLQSDSGSDAELYIQTSAASDGSTICFGDNSSSTVGQIQYIHTGNAMAFRTNGSERARINGSGHTTFGTTDVTPADSQVNGISLLADGRINHNAQSQPSLVVGRTGTEGAIVDFRRNGTTVGQIGSRSTGANLFITFRTEAQGDGCGLTGSSVSLGAILPSDGDGEPVDDHIDLGSSTNRFDSLFASSGTVSTSDRNEKQDIELLSDAEMRVAKAAKGLLRKYRWKSSVAEKGEEARIHFGIIAQDLQAAFEAEGLDAGRYGMWCSDTWTDEETGEERTRLGVRYSELLAFIIAVI